MKPEINKLHMLYAGLLVGTLDITTALTKFYISTGKDPIIIFKYIASGVLGMNAITSGGTGSIVLGLLLHYLIAMSFTVLFCLLYPRLKFLSANRVLTGILYGVFIWAIMNLIVVPLSQTPKSPFNLFNSIKEMLVLIVMIGLPLSFLARWLKLISLQSVS